MTATYRVTHTTLALVLPGRRNQPLLPEDAAYIDDGCFLSERCERCPLPDCLRGLTAKQEQAAAASDERYAAALQLRRERARELAGEGLSEDQIALRLGTHWRRVREDLAAS